MQCHMYTRDDIWAPSGKRCEAEATYVLRHKGLPVSYRCDEHTGRKSQNGTMQCHDSQYIPEPIK